MFDCSQLKPETKLARVRPLPETTFILDGRATLFKRPRSSLWQVRFKVEGRYRQFTTGTDSLN